jgi:hypothetical protein
MSLSQSIRFAAAETSSNSSGSQSAQGTQSFDLELQESEEMNGSDLGLSDHESD